MKNKALVIAGVGSALAIAAASALSFVSANETTAVTNTATTQTRQGLFQKAGGKKMVKFREGGAQHDVMMMGAPMAGKVMMRFGMGNEAMQTAVKNNDYNAFVTAWNADTNKPSDATVPTQEQFSKMVEMEKKHTAIETALETNDYDGYVKAITPTREEFDTMVKQRATQKAMHDAIEAQDYEAFKAATKDMPMFSEMTEEEFKNIQKMQRVELKEQNK